MAERSAAIRLRRVRFKSGGEIVPLHVKGDAFLRDDLQRAARMVAGGEHLRSVAGYALVAWSDGGEVFCQYLNGNGSSVPSGGVAGYVHDVILAETAARWARDE